MVSTRHSSKRAAEQRQKESTSVVEDSSVSMAKTQNSSSTQEKAKEEKDALKDVSSNEKDDVSREESESEEAPELEEVSENAEHSPSCPNSHSVDPMTKEAFTLKTYLKGFAKRVVFCTLLIFIGKSFWPQIQPFVWPEEPGKEGKLFVLTDRSFRGHIRRGDHFVMMYAPWCGHCQQLKPVWEQMVKMPGIEGVKIGKVDCTVNTVICKEHNVSGYPTLLYFRNGQLLEKYDGTRSLPALMNFVQKKLGDPDAQPSSATKPKADKGKKKKSKKKTEL